MAVTRANIGVKTWDLIRSEFQVDLLPSNLKLIIITGIGDRFIVIH